MRPTHEIDILITVLIWDAIDDMRVLCERVKDGVQRQIELAIDEIGANEAQARRETSSPSLFIENVPISLLSDSHQNYTLNHQY